MFPITSIVSKWTPQYNREYQKEWFRKYREKHAHTLEYKNKHNKWNKEWKAKNREKITIRKGVISEDKNFLKRKNFLRARKFFDEKLIISSFARRVRLRRIKSLRPDFNGCGTVSEFHRLRSF